MHLALALAIAFYVVFTTPLVYLLWITGWRPWMLRPTVPAPREMPPLQWETPDQDNPIPWI